MTKKDTAASKGQTAAVQPAGTRKHAKAYKLVGSALLLFAFVTQQTYMANVRSQQDLKMRALQLYSSTYMTSLLYLSLYFTQGQTTDAYDGQVLAKAAQEHAMGITGHIVASDLPKSVRIEKAREVVSKAATVRDLETYNAYMDLVNVIEQTLRQREQADYGKLADQQKMANWICFAVYVLGSVLVWNGVRHE